MRSGGRGSVDRHAWDLVVQEAFPSHEPVWMNHQGEIHPTEVGVTLLARDYKGVGVNPFNGVVETSADAGGVIIKSNTKQGYDIATPGDSINLSYPNSETRRGRVGRGVAQTILTEQEQGVIVDED